MRFGLYPIQHCRKMPYHPPTQLIEETYSFLLLVLYPYR
nr:MAG TPA: hypothetical protein [Caudoviricetes sp.]